MLLFIQVTISAIFQSGKATIVEAAANYIKMLEDEVKKLQTLKQEAVNGTETMKSNLPSAANQEMPRVEMMETFVANQVLFPKINL